MSIMEEHHREAIRRAYCDHRAAFEPANESGDVQCTACHEVFVPIDYTSQAIARLEKAYQVYDRLDRALKALGPVERLADRFNVLDQTVGKVAADVVSIKDSLAVAENLFESAQDLMGPAVDALYDSPLAGMLGIERPPAKVLEG